MKIALIANPKNGGVLNELRAAVESLRAANHHVVPRLIFDPRDAVRYARIAARRGFDLVIAAGGDGTVNEVVNGIVEGAGHRPRLGIIPLGTANDFAKGLLLPMTIEEAAQVAVSGSAVDIDVASVNGRCFVNVSTGGFGPDITEAASSKAKKRFGKLAYLFTAMKKLTELEPARATFEAEGKIVYDGPFFFFAVGNARQTGGGTPVTPCADYSDAQLDLALVTGEKRLDFLTLLPDLRAGKHPQDPGVLYLKARELRVYCEKPIAVNADGEPLRGRRFEYRLLNQRITVMRT